MHTYTPILLGKTGEFNALSELVHLDKIQIIPLIQLLPDTAEKRVKGYVDTRIKSLVKNWSFFDNRIYLDFHYIGPNVGDLHHEFYDKIRTGLINIIPVISVNDNQATFEFVRERALLGICLRVTGDNMQADIINSRISNIVNASNIDHNEIDLLIDFGHVEENQKSLYINSFSYIINQIQEKDKLRKIIISCGSYPTSSIIFKRDNVYSLPRPEWYIWQNLRKNYADKLPLIYSDYGTVSTLYDPYAKAYEGTCSIKYTTKDNYVLFRGERASDSPIGNKQYQHKAQSLVKESFYDGPTYSWGDEFIRDCASATLSPGSPALWVKVSQNHHFVKILRLLNY